MSDVIKGCSFIKDINLVYASSYIYDNDKGVWPKLSVNYSNKVQFLYRINKGTFEVFDQTGVNAKKNENSKAHIPFKNIIFFGDGETDVPCFSVNDKNSGKNICVYEKDNEKSTSFANKLLSEGRVHYLINGDYSEGSEADKLIKDFITACKL